jgi:hypothetical protein
MKIAQTLASRPVGLCATLFVTLLTGVEARQNLFEQLECVEDSDFNA